MKFAVLGDLHHCLESSHELALLHDKGYPDEVSDIKKYLRFQDSCVKDILDQIGNDKDIDFVVQLGDFSQGDCDDEISCKNEVEYSLDRLLALKKEIHICKGNHDDEKCFDTVVKQQLDISQQHNSYSFERDESLFVILDYQEIVESTERQCWLERILKKAGEYKYVFVFSHDPVYPVSRSFFVDQKFAAIMRRLFKEFTVDCHFAGHTHEQIISTHKPGAKTYLQLISAPLGSNLPSEAKPLAKTRKLILPDDGRLLTGFLENTLPMWFVVDVTDNDVTIQLKTLGSHGDLGKIHWNKHGDDYKLEKTESLKNLEDDGTVFEKDKIYSAKISMVIYDYDGKSPVNVSLNGVAVGSLPNMGYLRSLEIKKDYLKYLQQENIIEIDNQSGTPLTLISLHLETQMNNGKNAYSNVSPHIYSNSGKWDDQDATIQYIDKTQAICETLKFK